MESLSLLVIALLLNSFKVTAYFGLTGRNQLSDLWSINLDAASLATSHQHDSWNDDSDDPEPSQEYQPIDMSPDSSDLILPKRRRVATGTVQPHMRNYKNADDQSKLTNPPVSPHLRQHTTSHSHHSHPGDYQTTYNNRRHRNHRITSQRSKNQLYDESYSASGTVPSNNRYLNYQNFRTTNKRLSTFRPYPVTRRHGVRRTHLVDDSHRVTSNPGIYRTHTARDTQAAMYHRPLRRGGSSHLSYDHSDGRLQEELNGNVNHDVKSNQEDEILSRDLKVLMNQSSVFSMPRIRSERESGKRRDLHGLLRKPQQYLIASSVSHSLSPSRVQYQGDVKYQSKTFLPKTISKNPKRTSNRTRFIHGLSTSGYGQPFLALDKTVLSSYSTFTQQKMANLTPMVESQNINKRVARKLCDTFKLTSIQRKKCKRDPGLPQVLAKATHIAAAECLYQFRFERWNCSLGTSRLHLLNKGNKETGFLYSISSAGLTHSIARACAEGHLEKCSCEESFDDHTNQQTWLWGGCGDNVRYAAKFVRRFLRARISSMDVRAEVDRHNSDLGIRIVKSNVVQTCKCHGVSGSCTTKTCWRKMEPFSTIGRKIKRAYDKAVKVENISNSSGRPVLVRIRHRSRRQKPKHSSYSSDKETRSREPQRGDNRRTTLHDKRNPNLTRNNHRTRATNENDQVKTVAEAYWNDAPKHKQLVYLENSPAYCKKSKFSLGTKGRICGKQSDCEKVCCGRGYTTHVRIVRRSCECQVKWCCYVQCKTCNERKQIHTCK